MSRQQNNTDIWKNRFYAMYWGLPVIVTYSHGWFTINRNPELDQGRNWKVGRSFHKNGILALLESRHLVPMDSPFVDESENNDEVASLNINDFADLI